MKKPLFLAVDPKILVREVLPKAKCLDNSIGEVWIDDGDCRVIGLIQTIGTKEQKIKRAWLSALGELIEHFKVQARCFTGGKK
jgi:hypothetical protein